jgi:DNA processing protein
VPLPLALVPGSPTWPSVLSSLPSAPERLWLLGREELLRPGPRLAIVGTRSPTPYGIDQATAFARTLAARGVTIVSGLARGIDAAAHAGALDAGGATVAVLASGVDRPWPDGELARRVASEGLLLSEYPPGQPPRRHHFRLRNRIVSGLSDAVLVVEAARISGALITAHWAAEQGRSVFALPGRVDQPMARGCHRLLREGASLVEDPDELVRELGWAEVPGRGSERADTPASPLLRALVGETLTANELAARLLRPAQRVLAELAERELRGEVARSPGGLWRLG